MVAVAKVIDTVAKVRNTVAKGNKCIFGITNLLLIKSIPDGRKTRQDKNKKAALN